MSGVSWDIQVLRAWLMVGQEHPYIGWWFRRTNQCDWRMLMRTFGDHVQKIERFQTFEGTSYRMRRFQDLLEESKEWALPPCKILVRWEKFPSQQEGTWSQLSKVLLRVRGFLGPGKAMVWGCLRPIFLCLSIISSQSWNRSHEKKPAIHCCSRADLCGLDQQSPWHPTRRADETQGGNCMAGWIRRSNRSRKIRQDPIVFVGK